MTVGQPRQLLHIFIAGERAERFATTGRPSGFAIDRGAKNRIAGKDVEIRWPASPG